ncbi:hypothetical protein SKAU_G00243890 [Synaphobranchus kaupii]|uniref:Uncharacterized protein n=1 Tax=Synaphobranchus kaupii TaxID=118154 RepID=A0A9Q1ISH7_SYNKA|nr:hypothetical protein SKAU_G00243890 [Synaphobranchus kaupii]
MRTSFYQNTSETRAPFSQPKNKSYTRVTPRPSGSDKISSASDRRAQKPGPLRGTAASARHRKQRRFDAPRKPHGALAPRRSTPPPPPPPPAEHRKCKNAPQCHRRCHAGPGLTLLIRYTPCRLLYL